MNININQRIVNKFTLKRFRELLEDWKSRNNPPTFFVDPFSILTLKIELFNILLNE